MFSFIPAHNTTAFATHPLAADIQLINTIKEQGTPKIYLLHEIS
jgi:hypothetical protein